MLPHTERRVIKRINPNTKKNPKTNPNHNPHFSNRYQGYPTRNFVSYQCSGHGPFSIILLGGLRLMIRVWVGARIWDRMRVTIRVIVKVG